MRKRSTKVWRVYLVEDRFWREFGNDYADKATAIRMRDTYAKNFPNLKYIARGVWIADDHPRLLNLERLGLSER